MGSLKRVIEQIDGTDDAHAVHKEALTALSVAAEAKAQLMRTEVEKSLRDAANNSNHTVPVANTVGWISETHAYSASNVDHIPDAVAEALQGFIGATTESVSRGVGGLISRAFEAFFSQAVGESTTKNLYYIFAHSTAVLRLDVKAWQYNIRTTSLRSRTEKAVAVFAAKSIVDISRIGFDTFAYLFGEQFRRSGSELSADELEKEVASMRAIWDSLRGPVVPASAGSAVHVPLQNMSFVTSPPGGLDFDRDIGGILR